MVWSLVKVMLFIAVVAMLSYAAMLLINFGGAVRFEIADYEISVSSVTFVLGVLLLFPSFWLLFKLLGLVQAFIKFLVGDETALSRYFDKNREKRGFEALGDGLMALASGDPSLALKQATKADRLLTRPELTGILIAEAAEKSGDKAKAMHAYKGLLNDDHTKFVGLTGILKRKLAEGESEVALKLAQKAFALNSGHEEVQNTLLRLQSGKEDWKGARETLAAKLRSRLLPRDVFARRDAVLCLAEAKDKISGGDLGSGERAALAANKAAPGLVPAAVLAAETKCNSEDKRAATRIIQRAWNIEPHPDLAAAFAAIEPDEGHDARKKRFARLIAKNRNDPESRMVMAEIAIAAEDFPEARRKIGTLAEEHPTVRSLTIMAAIERGEGGNEELVRDLLTKALSAPRGPRWICDACHLEHPEWTPVCQNCEGFDTVDWKSVQESPQRHPSSIGMLPLGVLPPTAVEAGVTSSKFGNDADFESGEGGIEGTRAIPLDFTSDDKLT